MRTCEGMYTLSAKRGQRSDLVSASGLVERVQRGNLIPSPWFPYHAA